MEEILLLQGLKNNTLVAGKTTAARIFIGTWSVADINAIIASIIRPDGKLITLTWTSNEIVYIPNSSNGPSIAIKILGSLLPFVGSYYFNFKIINPVGGIAKSYSIDRREFLPTKDLRAVVSRLWSGTDRKPNEIEAIQPAMQRLAALYPLRDGINILDGDSTSGLRYHVDDNPLGPPNQDGHLCPLFAQYVNRPTNLDSIDIAITYRFPNMGEGSGGNSNHHCPNLPVPFSVIVWGAPLASVFSQETGHSFGMESSMSPHLDPKFDSAHSKDEIIEFSDAELGFDIQFNQVFPQPVYDIMYPNGPDPEYSDPQHSLNSWDWEFLRKQLVKLQSTGPTGPFINWQNLEGHDLRPFPRVGKNADGRQEVFVIGGDNSLYHRWESSRGGNWSSWASLEGHDLKYPIEVTNNADGRLEVFVLGGDGKIYHRWQIMPNGNWNVWALLGGEDVKNFSVFQNIDGRLELTAIWGNGSLYSVWQTSPNGSWSNWANLGGQNLKGPVSLTRNQDGRLEVFVVGGDGIVYNKWQTTPNRGPWSDWSNLADPSLPQILDITSISGHDGRLYIFMMRNDLSISYRAQVQPNGGWGNPISLWGHDLKFPCAVAKNSDGRLEVFVVGGDGKVYNTWQIDISRLESWSSWSSLGGTDIKAGIGTGLNNTDDIDIYVIGGDSKLYRGFRTV